MGSNVVDLEGKPYGGSEFVSVIELPIKRAEFEGNGFSSEEGDGHTNGGDTFKVGLFGVCTLSTPDISYPDEDVKFAPVIESAQKAVDILRQEHQVDFVIAVTHIALGEDKQLAREVSGTTSPSLSSLPLSPSPFATTPSHYFLS